MFNLHRHVLWFLLSLGWVVCAPVAQAVAPPTPPLQPPVLNPAQVHEGAETANAHIQVNSAYGRLPMHFEPNRG